MSISILNTIPTISTLPGQGGGSSFINTKSLLFDGSNDWVNCGTMPALDGVEKFSISAWFKTDSTTPQGIVWRGANADFGLWIYPFGIPTRTIELNIKVGFVCRSIPVINTGIWYHLGVFYDYSLSGSARIRMYLDGDDITGTVSIGGGTGGVNSSTADFFIGQNNYSGSPQLFSGNIDEVAIWAGTDARAEISDIYNDGIPSNLNDLTDTPDFWWRMGENSTFSSQILMPENTNKDKFSNYSMDFDGSTELIDCGNDSSLQITSDISISCWFKTTDSLSVLVSKRNSATGFNSYGYQLYISGDKIYFLVTLPGNDPITGVPPNTYKAQYGPDVTDGEWHHVLGTIDQGNEISISVDGNTPVVTSLTVGTYADSTTPFKIGFNQVGAGLHYFEGLMDEVSVFNSVKVSGDFWDGSGKPTDLNGESGLVSWWRMGKESTFSTQWTIPDQIGSNDGTSVNMDIYNRIGDAPDSENNALSYNMDAVDIVSDTPPNP